MAQQTNILIFPAEGENAFELHRALRYAVRFKLFGASSREAAGHGRFVFERYDASLPLINDPGFITAFNAYLIEHGIAFIFPTHDSVAAFLKTHESSLSASVIGPSAKVAVTCRKKSQTYAAFSGESFCPVVYKNGDIPPFPAFIKPDQGQGGQNCSTVHDNAALKAALKASPDSVVMEFLPGAEFTVDCFTDRHGKLLFAGPRSRDVIRQGMSYVSRTVELSPEIEAIAATINAKLPMRGLWFFQIKTDGQNRAKLMEVAVRASCGMGLYRQLGVNLPLLSAYDALGMDVAILRNSGEMTMSRCLQTHYHPTPEFDTIYVDYDDTLCIRNKVNTKLMAFLYQCLNDGKRLVLVSKHDGDIHAELAKRKISAALFDEIIHVKAEEVKHSHLKNSNAIFIDNLFHERAEVMRMCGIPVYDADAVESLLYPEGD